jgi:hypothetical protein
MLAMLVMALREGWTPGQSVAAYLHTRHGPTCPRTINTTRSCLNFLYHLSNRP